MEKRSHVNHKVVKNIHTTKEFRYNYKQRKEQREDERSERGEEEKKMADRHSLICVTVLYNRIKGHLHACSKIYIGH